MCMISVIRINFHTKNTPRFFRATASSNSQWKKNLALRTCVWIIIWHRWTTRKKRHIMRRIVVSMQLVHFFCDDKKKRKKYFACRIVALREFDAKITSPEPVRCVHKKSRQTKNGIMKQNRLNKCTYISGSGVVFTRQNSTYFIYYFIFYFFHTKYIPNENLTKREAKWNSHVTFLA